MTNSSSGDAPLGRKQRILLSIERLSRRRYALVFVAAACVFAVSTWLGSRIRLESDVLKLIPQGNRQVDVFRSALHEFGSIDYLVILLKAGKDEGPDELEDFADLYAEKLRAREALVESVEYRFQFDERFMELFSENALLFLPPEQLPQIAGKLSDEAIRRQVRENRVALSSPAASLAAGLVLKDPLGLMPLLVGRLLSHRGALKVDLSDGYYLAQDNRTLIMLIKPVHPSQDLAYSKKLITAARETAEATRGELAEGGAPRSTTEVRFGGNPAILTEEASELRRTIAVNGIVSFVAVTLLYWVCYRRFAALLYSSVPLIVGQAMTFAVAALVLGTLNSASASLPALLMGLGTDFTIVMYARYVEERRGGATLAEATERMVGEGGLGVFTGAITSAGTFYAMCVSGFRGLRDLGFLIGTGILLCGLAILFLLPAMIAWNEGARRRKKDAVEKLHLQSFGLERLVTLSARHPRTAIGFVMAATALAGAGALSLDFDDGINSLRSNQAPSFAVQEEIAETFGASLSYMMAITEGPTVEDAVHRAQIVQERLKPFLADGSVASEDSILDYLPPPDRQRAVIEALRAGAAGPFDPSRVRGTFLSALDESGFRQEPFEEYLARLGKLLTPSHPIGLEDLEGKGLSRLVDRYVHRETGRVRIVTYLYTRDPRWRRNPPPGLVETVQGSDPGIIVTGTNVVGRELRHVFLRDSRFAVSLGLVLVGLLLWFDFRSLKLTAIALGQLLAGIVMMLGCMKLLGMSINYANAFVATMIMGVGIDYSIHLVHRLDRNGGRADEGALETAKGVVMAAATNVAGFGTLAFGSYPAMRSLGVVALIGSVTCLVTALTLVPALMAPSRDGRPQESPR